MKAASAEQVFHTLEQFQEAGIKRYHSLPKVRLKLHTAPLGLASAGLSFRDIAISTAVQCYASGVAKMGARQGDNFQDIADRTLDGGHHTTRQHAHYTFQVIGISRHAVASFFHNYPFYNSEQQSQRYADIKEGAYRIPANLTQPQETLFRQAGDLANKSFVALEQALRPELDRLTSLSYPNSWQKRQDLSLALDNKSGKLTQENARYVLPLGQETTLFHTLSELQLLRLWYSSQMPHVSDEVRYVISSMIQKVLESDPDFIKEIRNIPPEEIHTLPGEVKSIFSPVDGKNSSLLFPNPSLRDQLIGAIRQVLPNVRSDLSEAEVLSLLLDPSKNPHLSDTYDTGIHDPLTQILRLINLNFSSRLSHTAESQRQRHRMTPGIQASLESQYITRPRGFITPDIIQGHQQSLDLYNHTHEQLFKIVEECLDAGVSINDVLLLLPNSFALNVLESGDLYDWIHRWKQRTCYLAQGEIFKISIEQMQDLLVNLPEARKALQAPCGIRKVAGLKPYCPEGKKWCGQPVYNWTIEDYIEHRLV